MSNKQHLNNMNKANTTSKMKEPNKIQLEIISNKLSDIESKLNYLILQTSTNKNNFDEAFQLKIGIPSEFNIEKQTDDNDI